MFELKVILEGVFFGLTLSILLGPTFFYLMQASIDRGFRAGFSVALGILLGDIALVLCAYLGATQFFQLPQNKTALGLIGGMVIVIFGCASIFQKASSLEIKIEQLDYFMLGLKGLLINIVNPFVWLFWLGIISAMDSKYNSVTENLLTFLFFVLLTTVLMDFVKIYIAGKLKKKLSPEAIGRVNTLAGIALVIFGIVLIWQVR